MKRTTVRLPSPAHEMAQEEIGKQAAFLGQGLRGLRFIDSGAALEFESPEVSAALLATQLEALATRVIRGLRGLQRKVLHRSRRAEAPIFRGAEQALSGVHPLGRGYVGLSGLPLALFDLFDRSFAALGRRWSPRDLRTPTLIASSVLARCDYFRSFPHNVTFACHLAEDPARVEGFRARHHDRVTLDEASLRDMAAPEACLSPAVCYHVYALHEGQTLPAEGLAYAVSGKCFRYESSNLTDLRRLWDFTMREVVFLGSDHDVLRRREEAIRELAVLLDTWEIAAEIRTASDPFFAAPDAAGKTYFQLSSETKYEISALLPGGERLAVGSFNHHTDFFGRAFDVAVDGDGPMHSVCVAFGLERWVHAFLAQHGADPAAWPASVRRAIDASPR